MSKASEILQGIRDKAEEFHELSVTAQAGGETYNGRGVGNSPEAIRCEVRAKVWRSVAEALEELLSEWE